MLPSSLYTFKDGIRHLLEKEEGYKDKPYKDHLGHWTIGVGHNLEKPISHEAIAQILDDDIEDARDGCIRLFGASQFDSFEPLRQSALICLCFQLGEAGLGGFRQFCKAVKETDWAKAADELLFNHRPDGTKEPTEFAKQVPARAYRMAVILKDLAWPY